MYWVELSLVGLVYFKKGASMYAIVTNNGTVFSDDPYVLDGSNETWIAIPLSEYLHSRLIWRESLNKKQGEKHEI
jgi:hypothetical protein